MRLFIALELPPMVKETLVAHQNHLRSALGPNGRVVRWVDEAAMHLTLQFLGETDDPLLPAIVACVERHSEASDLVLNLERTGAFPNARRPQVLWCGVGGDLEALGDMQRALGSDLQPLGFVPETRPFRPHLTLGRVHREASPAQLAAIGEMVGNGLPSPPSKWACGPPVLFQSRLTPHGPIYTKMNGV